MVDIGVDYWAEIETELHIWEGNEAGIQVEIAIEINAGTDPASVPALVSMMGLSLKLCLTL